MSLAESISRKDNEKKHFIVRNYKESATGSCFNEGLVLVVKNVCTRYVLKVEGIVL